MLELKYFLLASLCLIHPIFGFSCIGYRACEYVKLENGSSVNVKNPEFCAEKSKSDCKSWEVDCGGCTCSCGCYDRCKSAVNESCGGMKGYDATACATGLYCKKTEQPDFADFGVCEHQNEHKEAAKEKLSPRGNWFIIETER